MNDDKMNRLAEVASRLENTEKERDALRDERDALIIGAVKEGRSARSVAVAAKLSHPTVLYIIKKAKKSGSV